MDQPQNNERLARVEERLQNIRETQQNEAAVNAERARTSDHNFSDIKEGLLHARIAVEKLGGVVDSHSIRLSKVEDELKIVDAKVDAVDTKVDDLSHKFDINKAKVLAYVAGIAAAMTLVWAVIDDPIKQAVKFLGQVAFGG